MDIRKIQNKKLFSYDKGKYTLEGYEVCDDLALIVPRWKDKCYGTVQYIGNNVDSLHVNDFTKSELLAWRDKVLAADRQDIEEAIGLKYFSIAGQNYRNLPINPWATTQIINHIVENVKLLERAITLTAIAKVLEK